MSWVEWAGFVTGALCVLLVIRQKITNFPIGIANNALLLVTSDVVRGVMACRFW